METGLKGKNLDTNVLQGMMKLQTSTSVVKFTRSGKGSISKEKTKHTHKSKTLLNDAYASIREAATLIAKD